MAQLPGRGRSREGGAGHHQLRVVRGRGLAHAPTTLVQQQGGFRLVHVPYRGGGPALQDALSAQVPLFTSSVVIIGQHIRAGTLRPLGITMAEETRNVPGVRSFAQQGFVGFEGPRRR